MRRIDRVWSAVAVAVVTCAASVFAGTTPQGPKHMIGSIAAYDAKAGVIEVKSGSAVEKFRLDAATTITDHGAAIQAAALQKGQRVDIEWTVKNGHSVASKLSVLASPSSSDKKGR